MGRCYIERLAQGGGQLIVDGKPYLMRAAELNNSSLSSRAFMKSVFPRMVENNVNTLLGAISWQQVEPKEDIFDFEELTGIIEDARTHGLRLILLWFGAYKNGMQILLYGSELTV
jgi:beta-galactosidase GanA